MAWPGWPPWRAASPVLPRLEAEIRRIFDPEGNILNSASPALGKIRARVRIAHDRVREKLHQIINSDRGARVLQEPLIVEPTSVAMPSTSAETTRSMPSSTCLPTNTGRARDRVLAVEAGPAERVLGGAGGPDQRVQRQVGQRVRADEVADLARPPHRSRSARAGWTVDPVEARPPDRRDSDPQVDLGGAGLAEQLPGSRWVSPRTIESSTTTSRLPRMASRSGFSLSRMPSWRIVCDGWMNVRPT